MISKKRVREIFKEVSDLRLSQEACEEVFRWLEEMVRSLAKFSDILARRNNRKTILVRDVSIAEFLVVSQEYLEEEYL